MSGAARVVVQDFVPAFFKDGGFYLLVFTLTHVLDAAGASSGEVALVFGVYTLIYAALAPFLGHATDALGRRRSVLAGAATLALVSLLLGAVYDLSRGPDGVQVALRAPPFLAGVHVLGVKGLAYAGIACLAVGNGLFWPAFQARIGDRERDPEALGRAIRAFNLGWTSGKATGFLAAGLVFSAAPGACLPLVAGAGAVVFLTVALGEREGGSSVAPGGAPAPSDPAVASAAAGVESERPRAQKRAYLLAGLVCNFALWGSLSTLKSLAPKLGTALGADAAQTGALLFCALAAQGAGFLLLGRGGGWTYRPAVLLVAPVLATVGLALLGATDLFALALLGGLFVGGAQAIAYAASVFYSLDYDERRGLRTGVHEAVLGLGGALPIAGGALADWTGALRAPLFFAAAVDLAALALIALLVLWRARGRSLVPSSRQG